MCRRTTGSLKIPSGQSAKQSILHFLATCSGVSLKLDCVFWSFTSVPRRSSSAGRVVFRQLVIHEPSYSLRRKHKQHYNRSIWSGPLQERLFGIPVQAEGLRTRGVHPTDCLHSWLTVWMNQSVASEWMNSWLTEWTNQWLVNEWIAGWLNEPIND